MSGWNASSRSSEKSRESVSILVSDRKKRRKDRRSSSLCFCALKNLSRWWFFLLLLPAFMLLMIEMSKSGRTDVKEKPAKESLEVKRETNLDRLDMPTRSVNGVRQPCLKLLPENDIKKLDFPFRSSPDGPVKHVIYAESETDEKFNETYYLSNEQNMTLDNFNLFSGNQTFEERHDSFKLQETMKVNCGFFSKIGGFDVDLEDKMFLNNCKAVVSTCTFGGGDDLYQPIGMVETSLQKVCYVAFWDDVTLQEQQAGGKQLGNDRMVGLWRVVVVHNLPFIDQRLNGKIPKMLAHRLFPLAQYSIWVDSKSQFRRDPMAVFESLLWHTNSVLAISEHGARSCVYDEGMAIVKKHKATPEEVDRQLTQYRIDGYPADSRFDGHKALAEASIIVREHTPMTNLFMCLWFNEAVRFTSRDQLSFPFVLRHLRMLRINMFPVCTRRALVNSMGHKHKAKPLIQLKV